MFAKQRKALPMITSNLLLPIVLFCLNFYSYDIPRHTNQAFVQSSTTQLAQSKIIDESNTLTQNFIQKYQASPKPLILTTTPNSIPTPTPSLIPTPTPTHQPTPITIIAAAQVDSNLNPQSLFNAINNYRIKKGLPTLQWDQKLANYAQNRSTQYQQSGSMDHHAEFRQLTSNSNGFYELGFRKLGENSSSGFSGNPVELVENLYAGSTKHQENQLNPDWSHMGTGVTSGFTNIVFGGGKI